MAKVLFILKENDAAYGSYSYSAYPSSGLFQSATLVSNALIYKGIASEVVFAIDNNCIDKLVTLHKPTHVVIEALWVVPSKFSILTKLHPNVKWTVRLHSEIPFLATEGIAMDWIKGYAEFQNVQVSSNSTTALQDINIVLFKAYREPNTVLLPNVYTPVKGSGRGFAPGTTVNIACFGALRPLKNQLIQAVAAQEFAEQRNLRLNFHINSTRIEGGDNVLKNLIALFKGSPHQLIQHPWTNHETFLKTLTTMDIGMQVSFSETFNIVAADMVATGLPIVVSPEVFWTSSLIQASPTSTTDIVAKLNRAVSPLMGGFIRNLNAILLNYVSSKGLNSWLTWLK
jgi:hypothetical protein